MIPPHQKSANFHMFSVHFLVFLTTICKYISFDIMWFILQCRDHGKNDGNMKQVSHRYLVAINLTRHQTIPNHLNPSMWHIYI